VADFTAREHGRRAWDLVIGQAFLDLIDMPTTLPGLCSLVRPGGLLYFPTTLTAIRPSSRRATRSSIGLSRPATIRRSTNVCWTASRLETVAPGRRLFAHPARSGRGAALPRRRSALRPGGDAR